MVDAPGNWTLWYQGVLIGQITDPCYSDNTWWGVLKRIAQADDGELSARLLSFVDFCEDWNERTGTNPADQPSAADFDVYDDLLYSGLWFVRNSKGEQQIDTAPLFHAGGEFSWRVKK